MGFRDEHGDDDMVQRFGLEGLFPGLTWDAWENDKARGAEANVGEALRLEIIEFSQDRRTVVVLFVTPRMVGKKSHTLFKAQQSGGTAESQRQFMVSALTDAHGKVTRLAVATLAAVLGAPPPDLLRSLGVESFEDPPDDDAHQDHLDEEGDNRALREGRLPDDPGHGARRVEDPEVT